MEDHVRRSRAVIGSRDGLVNARDIVALVILLPLVLRLGRFGGQVTAKGSEAMGL